MNQPSVLSCRQVRRVVNSAWEQEVGCMQSRMPYPCHHAVAVCSVILNCTGRCVFCCMIVARLAMCSPLQTSRTRSFVKSHARSLLSMARLNMARPRTRDESCRRTRIAQISLSFSGGFWPVNLPLFHGTRDGHVSVNVLMTI